MIKYEPPYRWVQRVLPFRLLADLSPIKGTRRKEPVDAYRRIEHYELKLAVQLANGLYSIPGVTTYGPPLDGKRVSTFAYNVEGVAPLNIAKQLALTIICSWPGNYYAVNVVEGLRLAQNGAVRLGIVHYISENDMTR